jgi:hypothetical protein
MPKYMLAFFVGIFLLGGGLGFGVAKEIRVLTSPKPKPFTPANQVNIILVRLSDQSQEHSQLISVWGLFISRTEFPSLIMKRIYPEVGTAQSDKIGKAFSLNSDHQPSVEFMDAIRALDLPSAAIMLVDDLSFPEWISALAGPSILETSQMPSSFTNLLLAQKLDQELNAKACSAIENQSMPISPASTSIGQEQLAVMNSNSFINLQQWKGLVTTLHFANCEVLVNP